MGLIPDIFTEGMVGPDGTAVDFVSAPAAELSVQGDQPTFEEAFGTEAPGPGWIYAGEMRWIRGLPRKKESEEKEKTDGV